MKYRTRYPVLISVFITAALNCQAVVTDTIAHVAGSRLFEILPVTAPWTGTANPAALSTFSVGNLSLAGAGFRYVNDEIRLIQQPEVTKSYHAVAKGFMELGKLSLSGSFGYSNNHYNGMEYNGTMMFSTLNPYLLGDTVPAVQFREQFEMQGRVSRRISERIMVAAGAEYLSAVGAKQKDPRNKNTISSLRISPGVIYDLGRTKIGLSGSVYTTSDLLSYSVEGNWQQSLFIFLGLGYYRPEINITSYSQWYKGKGYSSAFQTSHSSDNMIIMTEIGYDHFTEEARSGSSYRLIDGIAETDCISLSGLLRMGGGGTFHVITLNGSLKAMSADEILQRSFKITKPTYSYDSLATVSWIKNKHMINDMRAEARYSYIVLGADRNVNLETGGGVTFDYFSTEHYPLQSYGYYKAFSTTVTLFAGKLFRLGRINVTPGLDASYRINLGSDISYTVQPLSVPDMVYHDYYVMKANMFRAGFALRTETYLTGSKLIKSAFIVPAACYRAAPGSQAGDLSGYMFSVIAGVIF